MTGRHQTNSPPGRTPRRRHPQGLHRSCVARGERVSPPVSSGRHPPGGGAGGPGRTMGAPTTTVQAIPQAHPTPTRGRGTRGLSHATTTKGKSSNAGLGRPHARGRASGPQHRPLHSRVLLLLSPTTLGGASAVQDVSIKQFTHDEALFLWRWGEGHDTSLPAVPRSHDDSFAALAQSGLFCTTGFAFIGAFVPRCCNADARAAQGKPLAGQLRSELFLCVDRRTLHVTKRIARLLRPSSGPGPRHPPRQAGQEYPIRHF